MKSSPKTGTTGEQRFVVEPKHTIDFADGRMPAVLCTPWLIWFLEHAARDAVLPFLKPGESTVGTFLEVRHLAPTPVGADRDLPSPRSADRRPRGFVPARSAGRARSDRPGHAQTMRHQRGPICPESSQQDREPIMTSKIQRDAGNVPNPSLTRRDLLCRGSMGMGALALSGVHGRCVRGRNALGRQPRLPAGAEATALCRQGQTRDSPVLERRSVPRRYLRPQAGPRQIPRPGTPQEHAPGHRTPNRYRDEVALQVPALRPERDRSQ